MCTFFLDDHYLYSFVTKRLPFLDFVTERPTIFYCDMSPKGPTFCSLEVPSQTLRGISGQSKTHHLNEITSYYYTHISNSILDLQSEAKHVGQVYLPVIYPTPNTILNHIILAWTLLLRGNIVTVGGKRELYFDSRVWANFGILSHES